MPTIFDNISEKLAPNLVTALEISYRADFCVGYFNLRGWKLLSEKIESWHGTSDSQVRLLVGMQSLPQKELRDSYSLNQNPNELDNATAKRWLRDVAQHFKEQLTYGAPSNADEAALKQLSWQLKSGKVRVKLSVRQGLHAKLYLLHRHDPITPIIAYLGSSNLTLAGLERQGELNVDVLDQDSAKKLASWFNDRWDDRWSIDISQELIEIIDRSWAGDAVTPHQIYVKMAYELSREARAGLSEYNVPKSLYKELFEYQRAAVSIAAQHVLKRGGVVLGDVVGLGKTLMATALVKILEEDFHFRTLIICPKNLTKMWQDYVDRYDLNARVLSISQVILQLPETRPNQVVLIDESHNLRNREGRRFGAIKEYIAQCRAKCILVSATPYNKTYLDLSSQLALFLKEDFNLGIRPEALIRHIGEFELERFKAPLNTLKAFEKSEFPDDWRELMRLFMVRRTRSFIQNQQSSIKTDESGRVYLPLPDGKRSYFPTRIPKTVRFQVNDLDPNDPYARLYAPDVVNAVGNLILPRYGLGNYIQDSFQQIPTIEEQKLIQNLGRAGKRLIGFCRTNLFKRLESGGTTFVQSLERHVLRNYIFLHALENNLPLPIGTQNAELLDLQTNDEDSDIQTPLIFEIVDDENTNDDIPEEITDNDQETGRWTEAELKTRAGDVYASYAGQYKKRFKWLRSDVFNPDLIKHLQLDATAILEILERCGRWNPDSDAKLKSLHELITKIHPNEKILVFTQFADTVRYLTKNLKAKNIDNLEGAVGSSGDPTGLAWRFSPHSNNKKVTNELRVLIATDVLSEGQNLQDAHIVVNFDLPWAIIRLIQRAGRVDRIGQQAEEILCYSFLPAEGIERIIRLRQRVRQRLTENAEVVGTDEQFFEDDDKNVILDLYNEKSGLLDDENDNEVDLTSYAHQIWTNAIAQNPQLEKTIIDMPNVVYAAKANQNEPRGALVYARTAQGNDALTWVDEQGQSITQSQLEILKIAACDPNTPSKARAANHHDLVKAGVNLISKDEENIGGQLGKRSSARNRTYDRLKNHRERIKGSLFENQTLTTIIDTIYQHPLREEAERSLSRQLKNGITDEDLANMTLAFYEDGRLCNIQEDTERQIPQIICSLGLV